MKKGFTLIELLVVIAIIGIIGSVVASVTFTSMQDSQTRDICEDEPKSFACENAKRRYCEIYDDVPMARMPAKCMKYYTPANATLDIIN